ncbi:TetR/AcrR family transcriptional regulator [Hymenobacter sp. BT491]|uniref:TetR/AcrR family transcriptional regulator n=1 Tax=Hymenobacter sp. BT491 TaxID=2766779 RepID=UPI00165359E0|nr:TetR/AcrR family transcriptional regulator [Hymenobacter sp. BT491]MBC6991443.1 TetR/AcrR family transcriptional regulator [Hymenobacter sp. BT491]
MEIKDRILQSAQGLFMRNGIKSVSMDDIASHLAMSKKTLYKWFENKDQIVYGVMEHHLLLNKRECDVLSQRASSAIEELFVMMGWMKKQFADVHPSIFYDLQKYHPATWQMWLRFKNQFILNQIESNLQRGISEGLYRPDLDVDVLARLRLAEIELAFNPEVYPASQFEPRRVQLIHAEHFMLGLVTLEGYNLITQYRHLAEAK